MSAAPAPRATYRIAGHLAPSVNLTAVQPLSRFESCIAELFARIRPRRLIETGTYHGTGSTRAIARSLHAAGVDDAEFISIEVNPRNYAKAIANLQRDALAVRVLNGVSIPRRLLPTHRQIEDLYVRQVVADGIFVDHEAADRAALYFNETDFPELPDDLLGRCLREFEGRPDFVFLDSGGHMGFVEFNYLIDRLCGPCHIALDDVRHVKHCRSLATVKADARFEMVMESDEKFGFCIARFTPAGSACRTGTAAA